jgi:hypothetical protein
MEDTAKSLGTTTEKLANMSAEEQLVYVEKYLASSKGKLNSVDDFYMKVLWPVGVGKSSDTVIWQKNSASTFIQNCYRDNSALDWNKDGKVTKWEAATGVRQIYDQRKAYKWNW